MSSSPNALDEVARLLEAAESILFVSGAGISADSGLPTYRGVGGLYADADTEDGVPIEAALSGPMFARRPALTWKYIRQIEEACRGARPNLAHRAIAAAERAKPRVWVLTQNVDGLHVAAGSRNVIPIHGDVHRLRCTLCSWQEWIDDFSGLPPLPHCPRCRALARPNVVLFGEMLPTDAVATMDREIRRGFDAVVSIGTSSVFPYIAQPMLDARRAGRPAIEINPSRTDVSDVATHRIELGAAEAMDLLGDRLSFP